MDSKEVENETKLQQMQEAVDESTQKCDKAEAEQIALAA
jgi:hypothetical protein